MNLYNLSQYNARLLADFTCQPANRDNPIVEEMSMSLLFDKSRYTPKELNFSLLFEDEYPIRDYNISAFLADLDIAGEVSIGDITYRGAFVAKKGDENVYRGSLDVKGIVLALEQEKTVQITSASTVDNSHRQEVPVTVITTGAATIQGLSKDPIVTTGAVTITDDGLILLPDGTNGSDFVEMEEFPHLKTGLNPVQASQAITLKYRPRLI